MSRQPDLWIKFYPADYLRSTRRLTLEQRGAYMDTIALQYVEGGPLPADGDMSWLAHQMHISTRKARAIVNELINAMRLLKDDRGVYDERAMRELEAREEQRKLSAQGASKMQADRKANQARLSDQSQPNGGRLDGQSAANQPRVSDESATNQKDLKAENSKFANKNSPGGQGDLPLTSPTRTRAGARLEIEGEEEGDNRLPLNPPSGERGGAAPSAEAGSDRSTDSDRQIAAAFDLWNAFAVEHRLGRVDIQSPARKRRMRKRLAEIGGLENFKLALSQVAKDDFLMGRVEPRNGSAPYRLRIEGLLSTDSNMGDVLARLIEKAREGAAPAPAAAKLDKPDKLPPEFWWRGIEERARKYPDDVWEDAVRKYANGVWPEKYLGPPPGDPGCLVPYPVIRKLNLLERYGNRANHG